MLAGAPTLGSYKIGCDGSTGVGLASVCLERVWGIIILHLSNTLGFFRLFQVLLFKCSRQRKVLVTCKSRRKASFTFIRNSHHGRDTVSRKSEVLNIAHHHSSELQSCNLKVFSKKVCADHKVQERSYDGMGLATSLCMQP
ncbi:hypothetical protein RB195_001959 [Necator americanus]|uniref:Uncharacterized protein n=1 Tax=Necator americanus TaxID=51031 RepID=A0ABR1DGQ8_NECAM